MSYEALAGLVRRLQKLGPSAVVITGIRKGSDLVNAMAEGEGEVSFLSRKAAGEERPGTGDVFSSIIAGGCIRGWSLKRSVNLAADFVRDCIVRSGELQIPVKNGVCFELLLGSPVPDDGQIGAGRELFQKKAFISLENVIYS